MSAQLHFYGAAGCVTGSCMLVETSTSKVLIDCGMFQGTKTLKALNYGPFPFEPSTIDAVLLTHAHIDHSGLLPKLYRTGFDRPVYATAGTRDLCAVLLPDAGVIQEIEVQQLNRRNRRRATAPVEPIYGAADAHETLRLFRSIGLGDWIAVAPNLKARWWNAGHILGSASIELEIGQGDDVAPIRMCFSGDLGPGGRSLEDDPQGPSNLDHLVMESTYGGVERETVGAEARRLVLKDQLLAAHAAGGPLLIPAFAVERTQELLVDLLDLMEKTEAPPGPIFLDSPLAIKATDVFLRRGQKDNGENPFGSLRESRLLRFTESAEESREIERQRGWHVIIAASGMCDAGRVRGHLRRLLPRDEATVLIVGYQAVGTLGRLLLEGRRDIRIQGDEIAVRARIKEIDVYSGHADAIGLVRWAEARRPLSGSIFLSHGEKDNLVSLEQRLVRAGFDPPNVTIAELDRVYSLDAGARAQGAAGPNPRLPPGSVSKLDWHNTRAAFFAALQKKLDGAPNDDARERLLASLSDLLGKT